ncbi:glutamate--tRNA ligase [Brevibacterium sp. BDJS002]|uniref:Glutamate--tRNA ligase n=1 Tax=Brevibacterium aurantiacum TaxID=273384 RepID=A0A2H1JUF6_BREAU|nr:MULTISPECIES: glutamate--tRNA ligase [Brevibacterium]WCE38989.1 glutamate--tRNA ligase [Brevibacterium sp. BDJS002]GEB24070.1 glutamate--tRNA ligase [Brevibacterium aurantiacum]SMX91130.1 glutamyl-tRNA synthetase [Brevibacterium aurantiacum]
MSVKVRFCPSPTGTPHVGMVRTALFNWAYAKHTGGKFVFRIEDTDAARDSEESFGQVVEAMKWLGLDWDEGIDVGGPDGPYRQSQRGEIYQGVIEKLKAAGHIYESYSTNEEVEARHKAAGRDPKLGYDGYDRDLTSEQIAGFKAEGREPVWRVRMPAEDVTFTDLVRGEITFRAGTIPDYVVVRANGQPLYTLVNPVDDALMGITHVLRGEDLLSSTPRQVVLYEALKDIGIAEATPEFGHLPYVMGDGNKKLSKRDPQSNLFLHRDNGFIPEGMINYLGLLGWSIGPDRDVFSVKEFVEAFDIHDVLPNPARFDVKKATAINADHIRLLEADDFRDRLVPYLQAAEVLPEKPSDAQLEILNQAAPLVQTRMNLLAEAPDLLAFLFTPDSELTMAEDGLKTLKDSAPEVLAASIEVLEATGDWTTDTLHSVLQAKLVDEMEIKPRLAFGPLRVAVSGRKVSPPLFESMEILGKDSSLTRLRALAASL